MNGNEKLWFRKPNKSDCHLLLKWANEEETRKQSFQTHYITPEEHSRWFQNVLTDENVVLLILCLGEAPIGNIRFVIDCGRATLSYSIDHRYRGRGFGRELIRMGLIYAEKELAISEVRAETKPGNIASQRVLLDNGFQMIKQMSGENKFVYSKAIRSSAIL